MQRYIPWALLCLIVSTIVTPMQAFAAGGETFTNREFIRNGTFDARLDDWGWNEVTTTESVGVGTDPVLVLKTFLSRGPASAWQEIYLPTRTTAATVSFDYRMVPGTYGAYGGRLVAGFIKHDGTQATEITSWQVTPVVTGDTGWQRFQHTLSDGEVAAIQAAHQAKQRVYLLIQLVLNQHDAFQAYVDNVSLKLSGEMVYPQLSGRVAYRGVDHSGRYTIGWMNPDGSNRHVLWTYPVAGKGKIFGLAWRPDGSEIAFTSDHEAGYSRFHVDVYRVRVSDGRVRRVTNPPSHADMQSGGYGRGTVSGVVHNNSNRQITAASIYVQGAATPIALGPLGPNSTASFVVPNVADLGSGTLQYIVLIWMDSKCSQGLYTFAGGMVDVRAGKTTSVGTLNFVPDDCQAIEPSNPSWRPDGALIGFSVNGVAQMVTLGGLLGDPFTTNARGVSDFSWSPQGDGTLLYASYAGIYQTTEGGGQGTLLVNAVSTGISTQELAWLPDGSGFVYTDGLNFYLYRFSTGQVQPLTQLNLYRYTEQLLADPVHSPTVSPDGKYLMFDRRTVNGRDLWILNLENPVELWPVTTDGRAAYPDWGTNASGSNGARKIYIPHVMR